MYVEVTIAVRCWPESTANGGTVKLPQLMVFTALVKSNAQLRRIRPIGKVQCRTRYCVNRSNSCGVESAPSVVILRNRLTGGYVSGIAVYKAILAPHMN